MNNATDFYVGMDVSEATRKAVAAGFQVSVDVDGMQQLNCEYRAGRITFRVVNDKVLSAQIG
jgi:hypothetical protein